MPTSHDLKGLMKFLDRDEWNACFDEVFDAHVGPVLDAGDMELSDLAEILGADYGMTLWGCAFEDFLTQDFDVQGGNIVDEYLKRRGWKENAQAKAYMKALRNSVMSLYEVSEIVPGKSLLARDLIRGGEPVAVSEGTATKTLKQWDRIAARIVPVLGKSVFAGGLLPFTPDASEALFDGLRRLFGRKNARKLPAINDEDLQAVAFLFTLSWLFDTLGRSTDRPLVQNMEGDDLVFHDVRFPLASGVKQKDVAARLNALPELSQENANFWNWLEATPHDKNHVQMTDALTLDTTMESGLRVLGAVELKERFLIVSTNSAARAAKGKVLIEQTLGALVRTPLTEIRDLEQMMAEQPDEDDAPSSRAIPPELAGQLIHQLLDRQYHEILDQTVGMLGGKTPRQAAKTPAGRQKVVAWLKYLENHLARQPDPNDPMATYDFSWMWNELGVSDLRR